MENVSVFNTMMPYIRYACWAIIIGGGVYVAYKRTKKQIVKLNDVTQWAEEHKNLGAQIFVSALNTMPDEVRKEVRKELGFQNIINAYKENGSVHITIVDAEGKIVGTHYIMGKQLDDDLLLAMGETGLNIKLS